MPDEKGNGSRSAKSPKLLDAQGREIEQKNNISDNIILYKKRIVKYAVLILGAITGLSVFIGNIDKIENYIFGEGRLSIVEVNYNLPDSDGFTKIDVKLRNTGEVAFLKSASFTVSQKWLPHTTACFNVEPVSWDYSMELPYDMEVPHTETISLSQSVKRGGVDRFSITVDTKGHAVRGILKLLYNEQNESLATPELIFYSPPARMVLAYTHCGDPLTTYVLNRKSAEEMLVGSGAVRSDWVTDFHKINTASIVPEIIDAYEKHPNFRSEAIIMLRLISGFDETAVSALSRLKADRAGDINIEEAFSKDIIQELVAPLSGRDQNKTMIRGLSKDDFRGFAIYLLHHLSPSNDEAQTALKELQN